MKPEMLHGKMPAPEEQTSSPEASRLVCGSACKPSGEFSSPGGAALSKPRERIPFPMVIFFVERPIFVSAIASLMVLAGSICYSLPPVAQFLNIMPPQVIVSARYPGASAQVVADTVTTQLEQQINGSAAVTITFDVGYPIDIAAVDVQNRVSQAAPWLPAIVNRAGMTIWKQNPSFALIVNLTSPDGSVDPVALSNHTNLQIADPLKRLAGVGDVTFLGERRYSMRVWLNPDKLAKLGITAMDVQQAIAKQKSDRTAWPTVT